MPKTGESTRSRVHNPVLELAADMLDKPLRGDVTAHMAARAEAALTPKIAKAYGPKQRKYREPLTSGHHFGTMSALRSRAAGLDNFTLTQPMRAIMRQWGATYTQALFTGDDAKSVRILVEELTALRGAVDAALKAYGANTAKKGAKK
jgi:hypothetical protein